MAQARSLFCCWVEYILVCNLVQHATTYLDLVLPRWHEGQFYVMQAETNTCTLVSGEEREKKKYPVNKKNGICLAVKKNGGWHTSWFLARQLAGCIANTGSLT